MARPADLERNFIVFSNPEDFQKEIPSKQDQYREPPQGERRLYAPFMAEKSPSLSLEDVFLVRSERGSFLRDPKWPFCCFNTRISQSVSLVYFLKFIFCELNSCFEYLWVNTNCFANPKDVCRRQARNDAGSFFQPHTTSYKQLAS